MRMPGIDPPRELQPPIDALAAAIRTPSPDPVTARIDITLSDSPAPPADSGDEWAMSSYQDIMSDMDEDAHTAGSEIRESRSDSRADYRGSNGPSLLMPRMLMAPADDMGKLKVLVAGASGLGKAQLIEAMIAEASDASSLPPSLSTSLNASLNPSLHALELDTVTIGPHAEQRLVSTRSRARRSVSGSFDLGDSTGSAGGGDSGSLPDHNVAFVKIKGFSESAAPSPALYAELLASYLDAQFHDTASIVNGLHPEISTILRDAASLKQFPHVDVCLYMIGDELTDQDIVLMGIASRFAAVVPVLAKADCTRELVSRKLAVAAKLQAAKISTFAFDGAPPAPFAFAVSSKYEHNSDMTMSQVMAVDYREHVLIESELASLTAQLFSSAGAQQLRAHTARLFAEWVADMQLRSTLHSRLSRPLVVPKQVNLDMPWALAARGGASALAIPAPPLGPAMSPIGNVDPLGLFRWTQMLQLVTGIAALAFTVELARRYWKSSVAPAPPAPPKLSDVVKSWLRAALGVY